MSLQVGKTFCKGPRTTYRTIDPRLCVACAFKREDKTHKHTCGKEQEKQEAQAA